MTSTTATPASTAQTDREPAAIPPAEGRQFPWAALVSAKADPGETLTSSELLVRAGLNWGVDVRPLYRKMADSTFKLHPRMFEVYKTDGSEDTLGTVKTHYEPFSNEDAFAFGDSIVENGLGRWVHAGQQSAPEPGSRVFMSMLLKEFSVLGGDPYQLYLFLRASHDGSTGLNAWLLPFRVDCLNQMGLVNAAHLGHWTVLHTKNIKERLEEAQRSLREAVDYEAKFQQIVEKLAGTTVSDQKVRSVINRAVPEQRSRRDDVIADIRHVYQNSSTVDPFRGTAYGLLNAVTEYYDHVKPSRNGNARFESIMSGEGAKARAQALRDLAGLN